MRVPGKFSPQRAQGDTEEFEVGCGVEAGTPPRQPARTPALLLTTKDTKGH